MSFNIAYALITLIIIIFAVFLKGRALERLFYIYIVNLLIIVFFNKGLGLSLLFIGSIIPFLTRHKLIEYVVRNEKGSNKSMIEKLINYLCFAPLIGLGIMSYRIPELNNFIPPTEIKYIGDVSLIVITCLVVMPKRINLK